MADTAEPQIRGGDGSHGLSSEDVDYAAMLGTGSHPCSVGDAEDVFLRMGI